jgi:hypothetical protein
MTVQTEEDYRRRTHELTMQLAALELTTYVRELVADELMRQRYAGDYEIDNSMSFHAGEPPPILRHGALGRVLQRKDIDQKEATIRTLIERYVEADDLPPHRLELAETRRGAQYLKLVWDVSPPIATS